MTRDTSTAPSARRKPPARRPPGSRVALVSVAAGLLAALAVMAGLWAMGRWGMAWLVSELTGQARSPSDYQPFVMGPSTAAALAAALGLTAALNMWRGIADDRPSRSSSARRP